MLGAMERKSRISQKKISKLMEYFVGGITARTAASLAIVVTIPLTFQVFNTNVLIIVSCLQINVIILME